MQGYVGLQLFKAYFLFGEFVRANTQKSRNASYLFAANFFRQPILTNHVAGFLFSLRVAQTKSPSGKIGLRTPLRFFCFSLHKHNKNVFFYVLTLCINFNIFCIKSLSSVQSIMEFMIGENGTS